MSRINPLVSTESVIPLLDTDVFAEHETAGFAVGLLAVGHEVVPGREEELTAYLRLRANVYATQTQMISQELVKEDGTETDEDDGRSIHFAVIENGRGREGEDKANRLVSALRLIVKSPEDDRPLPVETFFPEAFPNPLPHGAVEVSRYICRHEVKSVQEFLKWPLYTKGLTHIASHNLGPTYGVVEPALERGLRRQFVPVERLGEPKFIPEYDAPNLPILIDTNLLMRRMEGLNPGMMQQAIETGQQFAFIGELPTHEQAYQATA